MSGAFSAGLCFQMFRFQTCWFHWELGEGPELWRCIWAAKNHDFGIKSVWRTVCSHCLTLHLPHCPPLSSAVGLEEETCPGRTLNPPCCCCTVTGSVVSARSQTAGQYRHRGSENRGIAGECHPGKGLAKIGFYPAAEPENRLEQRPQRSGSIQLPAGGAAISRIHKQNKKGSRRTQRSPNEARRLKLTSY